jgi:hypothetical protein
MSAERPKREQRRCSQQGPGRLLNYLPAIAVLQMICSKGWYTLQAPDFAAGQPA